MIGKLDGFSTWEALYETRPTNRVSPFGSSLLDRLEREHRSENDIAGRGREGWWWTDIGVIYGVVMGERAVVTWNLRDFFASIGGNHDI